MSDDLAMFDLPVPEPPPAASRSDRGRAGYRYARSVTVEVMVQRIPVLLDAAVRAFDDSPMFDIGEIDPDDEAPDSREQIGRDPAAALGCCSTRPTGCGHCWKPAPPRCSRRASTPPRCRPPGTCCAGR